MTWREAEVRFPKESRLEQKIKLNHRKNKEQDHTSLLDQTAECFSYTTCKDRYWNPEEFSLLYGTPLWDSASREQKIKLNQLYWVAYYCQIISAEIATIFFNQTSAASLFGLEDFRAVCDMLDLESAQERAHISAFKRVSEEVERDLFQQRLFTYPMRGPYAETMIFGKTTPLRSFWKRLQLQSFNLLSSERAFIGCQYFAVRGLRTLNGKQVQHRLSQFYLQSPEPESLPSPSKISYYHFMDESFHFNSSRLLSHEVLHTLKTPNAFEKWVVNLGVSGCQKDHSHFSTAINGIFWYDPALFETLYHLLRSPLFGMAPSEALQMLEKCFTQESEGLHQSFATHQKAIESYRAYVQDLSYLTPENREMRLMSKSSSLATHLQQNRSAFHRFKKAKSNE
jgi:hypothetical protein